MKNKAIILFTRIPVLGETKTRLEPFLRPQQCVELQTAFIKDIYQTLQGLSADILICYSQQGELRILQDILGKDANYIPQLGDDLGSKMHHALASALKYYEKAVLIGSDLPLIESGDIESAFGILETKDIAIAPTYDGGYYLIGMKRPHRELFQMHYSTSSVYDQTLNLIIENGLSYGVGTVQLDIDEEGDFLELYAALKRDPTLPCAHTRVFVERILEEEMSGEHPAG